MTHRHEDTDVEPRYALYFGMGLAIAVILICVALWVMFGVLVEQEELADLPPSVVGLDRVIPPEPRLQVTPEADNDQKLNAEEEILKRYEWIDRDNGKARIPIERAMDILAEKGVGGPANGR